MVLHGKHGADVINIKSVNNIQLRKHFETQSDLQFERCTLELLLLDISTDSMDESIL